MNYFYPVTPSNTLELSESDIQLLILVCNLGFVTASQLNMLYSVSIKEPRTVNKRLLDSWTKKGAPLNKRSLKNHGLTSKNRIGYTVSIPFRNWLLQNKLLDDDVLDYGTISITAHNVQAVEVIVQSMYLACFGRHELGMED